MSFYVTTPIYYVNAEPHLGHAYTSIAADVLARHHRQRGENVFFLTGTDEHGEPVALAAEQAGVTPRELGDRYAPRFRDLLSRLNVTNDFFIRTTDPQHEARVQEILQRVYDNGYVYPGTYEGWYCPRCADFKTESEIGPGNTCLIHEIALVREREDNYFFKLSAFQEPLERLYAARADFVMPRSRSNEAQAFIAQGLRDVSLTRANLKWGVPVPWDEEQVFYVWFDALLNYVTALTYARDGQDLTAEFWPARFQLIGKDILKFHCVYWPALLLAAGYEPPHHLFVHGFLLMDDKKMSKSLGNVLDPFGVIDRFGADALRFYCFREVPFGQDGSISPAGFETRYETELANDYGNLASRTLAMIDRYRDGIVPVAEPDPALAPDLDGLAARVAELLDRAELTTALEEVWLRVRRLNRFVEERAPWQLAKQPAAAAQLDQTLYGLAEGLRVITVLLHPYMPAAAERLLAALGRPELDLSGGGVRSSPGRRRDHGARAAVPQAVIDSHAHLDHCEPADAELVAAADRAGVRRLLAIGMDGASCRAALAAAEAFPQVYAAVGRHPHEAVGFDDADLAELRALAAHERCVAVGETGLDYHRDLAPRPDQARAFDAQVELAREVDRALVIHTRAAADDTLAVLRERAGGLRVILHCFSMPERLDECLAAGWWISFAGNVTYPTATELADAAARVPLDRLLVETDAPFLAPQPVRGRPNEPANVVHTARFVADRRGIAYEELEAAVERAAAEVFGW